MSKPPTIAEVMKPSEPAPMKGFTPDELHKRTSAAHAAATGQPAPESAPKVKTDVMPDAARRAGGAR